MKWFEDIAIPLIFLSFILICWLFPPDNKSLKEVVPTELASPLRSDRMKEYEIELEVVQRVKLGLTVEAEEKPSEEEVLRLLRLEQADIFGVEVVAYGEIRKMRFTSEPADEEDDRMESRDQ